MNRSFTSIPAILIWIIFLFILTAIPRKCHSQQLLKSIAKESVNVSQPHVKQGTFDTVLFSTDALLRTGDGITTYKALSDPCRCFREIDPIAPKGYKDGQVVFFQYSALMAVQAAHELLQKKGHPKLARWVYVADIISEGIAVGNNIHHLNQERSK